MYTLKKVKRFRGHDGYGVNCELFRGTKKVAFVFDELGKFNGGTVHQSSTNFLTFSFGSQTEALFNFMSKNDIAIRPVWHHPVLKEHVRVTISGKEEENGIFLEKVKEFVINN